jgi:glycosyltransferase involved in cell wall biosynthesis
MRVLFVNPVSELGGSERSLLDVLAALGQSAPDLDRSLLLFSDGELAVRARALGMEVAIEPLPAALGGLGEFGSAVRSDERAVRLARAALASPGCLLALRRCILSRRPDILHTNGMKAHVLAAAAAPELRRVVHLRDFVSERPLTSRILPWLGRRSVLVANSQAVAEDALRVAPSLCARVVYNGIDLSEFHPGPGDPGRLARLAGMGPPTAGTLAVGLVATYGWWKGHRRFLEAAAEVRAALPEQPLRFYVVGGPIYGTRGSEVTREELVAVARSRGLEGSVGFVPFQRDTAAVYRDLDIAVHASERPEPFGRTIVEAMATGRAVVAARAGGAAELFVDHETAVGYDPAAPGALVAALLEVVRDGALRARLSNAARLSAEQRFDRRRLGPELLAVYGELLGAQARARL